MKKTINLLAFLLVVTGTFLHAQNFYKWDGRTYSSNMGNGVWVGEIAVMNSEHGSFQVYFKPVPTKSGSYKVIDHLNFTMGSGKANEVGVVLLLNENSNQYWSVDKNKGKVQVKVSGSMMTITVKNVKVCIYQSNECNTLNGSMNINLN